MLKKTLAHIEHQILQITLDFVSSSPQCRLCPSETTVFQLRMQVEETYHDIFDDLDQNTIHQTLFKSIQQAILRYEATMADQEEATGFNVPYETLEIPNEIKIGVNQELEALNAENKNPENENLENEIDSDLRSLAENKSDNLPNIQPTNQGAMINQTDNQETVTSKKAARPKSTLRNLRIKRRIQTKKQIGEERSRRWPIIYITKEKLAQKLKETKKIEGLNDRFKRRFKRIINKEIRIYKEQLIDKQQVDKCHWKSHLKIETFLTRRQEPFQIFFDPIINIDPINWLRDYRSIKIGDIKLTYFINNLLNVQVTDFTFEDKTLQLRKPEFLALKKARFVSRLTGLLPKKRKIHYDKLFTLHNLLA